MMKDFFLNSKIKILLAIITAILFLQTSSQILSTCSKWRLFRFFWWKYLHNIILLENCEIGQFAEDKDGNMFLSYYIKNSDEDILFYGLNKNETNYFVDGPQKK